MPFDVRQGLLRGLTSHHGIESHVTRAPIAVWLAVFACTVYPGLARRAAAQALVAGAHSEAVPTEVADPVREVLKAGGLRATVAQVTIDFWWVTAVTPGGNASASPGATGNWQRVAEGTLVGAMRLSAPFRDIRGRTLKAGVYTLRYALQPVNGDHLGVSSFRDFLLASPASVDLQPAATGYEGAVNLSRQAIGTSHPAIFSIDPPSAAAAADGVVTNELGHSAVVVELPVTGGGTLRFGLVLVGRIDA